jgi:hypothetical protein
MPGRRINMVIMNRGFCQTSLDRSSVYATDSLMRMQFGLSSEVTKKRVIIYYGMVHTDNASDRSGP